MGIRASQLADEGLSAIRDNERDCGALAPDQAVAKEMLAGATVLEPAASCVTGRRSNQLNYAPA
jgi:hypothetical protein